jgi:hypothetical protein
MHLPEAPLHLPVQERVFVGGPLKVDDGAGVAEVNLRGAAGGQRHRRHQPRQHRHRPESHVVVQRKRCA